MICHCTRATRPTSRESAGSKSLRFNCQRVDERRPRARFDARSPDEKLTEPAFMPLLHTLPLTAGPWEAAYIKLSEHPIGARITGSLTDAGMVIVVDGTDGMVIGSEMVTSGDP